MNEAEALQTELKTLLSQGWKPRVRERDGKHYLALRRKKEERGFGLFTEEKKKIIDGFRESKEFEVLETADIIKSGDQVSFIFDEVKESLLKYKVVNCFYQNPYGFCDLWRLSSLPLSANGVDQEVLDRIFLKIRDDSGEVWLIKADHRVCNTCTAYIDKATIKNIQSRK